MDRKTSSNLLKFVPVLLSAFLMAGTSQIAVGSPTTVKVLPGGAPGGSSVLTFSVSPVQIEPGAEASLEIVSSQDISLLDGVLTVQFTPDLFINNPTVGFLDPTVLFSVQPQDLGTYRIAFQDPTGSLQIDQGKFMTLSGILRQDLIPGATVAAQVTADATRADGARLKPGNGFTSLTLVADDSDLILRVDGQSGLLAGGTVIVEVRTYNPKPISEGQICYRFSPSFFSSVNNVTITAAEPDVSFTTDTSQAGVFLIQFTSPSAAVNRLDGPMLAVEMTLATDLTLDAESSIDVDLMQSFMLDAEGQPVALGARSGRFRLSP